ncbi:hypothetical protein Q9L58_006509 [Maublancomyces gigas]|uniref:HNH nuclease domain-containing protein n=1 Tax=Discina gigas TaxID=1032678 RepID=A0ABR3GF53_9PEZI
MSETNSSPDQDSPTPSIMDLLDLQPETSLRSSRIALLPRPIDIADPFLLSRIFQNIRRCEDLCPRERRILRAFASNMPEQNKTDNAGLRRIAYLGPSELKALATIVDDGLRAIWEFGGMEPTADAPENVENDVDTNSENTALDKQKMWNRVLLAESDAEEEMSPDTKKKPTLPDILLFDALEIKQTLPNIHHVHHKQRGRHANLPEACKQRQNDTCPITGLGEDIFTLETALLVPHAAAAIETPDDAPFWRMLRLFLGPDLTDEIYGIVGGLNSYKTSNALCLGPGLGEGVFDHGLFYLVPRLKDGFKLDLMNSYDVEFKWRGNQRLLDSYFTYIPENPKDQINYRGTYNYLEKSRPIKSGNYFRLYTRDPGQFPLPHPLLLSLHNVLWEVIATAGIGEPYPISSTSSESSSSSDSSSDSSTSGTSSDLDYQSDAAIMCPLEVEYIDFRLNQLLAFRPRLRADTDDEDSDDEDKPTVGRLWDVDQFDLQMVENGFYDAENSTTSSSNDSTDGERDESGVAITNEIMIEFDQFNRSLAYGGSDRDGSSA